MRRLEPAGSIASHAAYPQTKSHFYFLTNFLFIFIVQIFLAFSPANPCYHWTFWQNIQANAREVRLSNKDAPSR